MFVSKIYGIVLLKCWSILNHTPTLPKSYSTLPKSHSDFTKITLQFCQKHTPTLPGSGAWLIFTTPLADFHKITLRLYQNPHSDFTKIADWFSQITDWFSQKRGLILKPQIVVLLYGRFKIAPSRIVRPACQKVSSFVTSLSGSPHCFCPCLWKKT